MAAGRRASATSIALALVVAIPLGVLQSLADRGDIRKSDSLLVRPGRWVEEQALDADYLGRYYLRLLPTRPPQTELVILAYDEETRLAASRYSGVYLFFSALLQRLAEAKPRAIFFDILFNFDDPPPDDRARLERVMEAGIRRGLPPDTLADLREITRESPEGVEEEVIEAFQRVSVTLPVACLDNPTYPGPDDPDNPAWNRDLLARSGAIPAPEGDVFPGIPSVRRFVVPNHRFSAVTSLAQSCELTDKDNILRSDQALMATVREGRRWLLPSAPVMVAKLALGAGARLELEGSTLLLGDHRLPLDPRGVMLLDVTGPGGSFQGRHAPGRPVVYSAHLVTEGQVPLERLKDKVILFGSTALGGDDKRTPFSETRTPGIEKIAMQADSILTGHPPYRPAWDRWGGAGLTALVALLAAMLALKLPPRTGFLAAPVGALLVLVAGVFLFARAGLWIESGFPALACIASMILVATQRYRASEEERKFVESAFGKYLAPQMVRRLLEEREALRLFGEERELTILFADLRGFTGTSERQSAAETVKLLNSHLTAMSEVILRHHGTVDKFIGDCVMAFWGAPFDDPEHARHACQAAMEMLQVMDRQNEERRARGESTVEMGIGINTGRVVVGNMGSENRFDYTVIGDAVNLASRLEGLTKGSASRVLCGEQTRKRAEGKGDLAFVDLGSTHVKGKSLPVPIFGLSATLTKGVEPVRQADPAESGSTSATGNR